MKLVLPFYVRDCHGTFPGIGTVRRRYGAHALIRTPTPPPAATLAQQRARWRLATRVTRATIIDPADPQRAVRARAAAAFGADSAPAVTYTNVLTLSPATRRYNLALAALLLTSTKEYPQ